MKQSLKEIGEILIAIEDGAGWEFKIDDVWNSGDGHDPVYRLYYQNEIRLKPRTVKIGTFDVPEPSRVVPQKGEIYYVAAADQEEYAMCMTGYSITADSRFFTRGLIHATAEAAALHGKALASLTSKEPIE